MGDGTEEQDTDDGLELVNLALKGGMITQRQWLDAFAEKTRDIKAGKQPRHLTDILVSKGLLTSEQLIELRKRKTEGWVVPTADPKELEETPINLKAVGEGEGQKRLGKYLVLGRLLVDARVKIYDALDTTINRPVALRLLRTSVAADPAAAFGDDERFVNDAEKSKALDHPNILRVYEAGVLEGRRYIATEPVRGRSMNEWLQGDVSLWQKVTLLRDVALAIQHAHEQGIIHQDIRPKNILVDERNQPHVTDFGMARAIREEQKAFPTRASFAAETVIYMSPEQAENLMLTDQKTDIYALGVILYEIITGTSPHRGKTAVELLMKKSQEHVPPPSKLKKAAATGVDRSLEKICMRSLTKDPAKRHETAREFAGELTAWLRGAKTPGAARPTKLYVAIGAIAAAVVLGTLILFLVLGSGAAPSEERPAPRKLLDLDGHRKTVRAVIFRPDGSGLISAGNDGKLRVWDASSGKDLRAFDAHDGEVLAVAFCPAGATMASGGSDHRVMLWQGDTGMPLASMTGHTDEVRSVAFSPDGKLVASAGQDGRVVLWDVAGRKQTAVLHEGSSGVQCAAFSPDGRVLACEDRNGKVKLLDLSQRRVLGALKGHTGTVMAVAFSPDGKMIATGAKDATARLWNAADGSERNVLKGHFDRVRAVSFSPDGRRLATGGGAGRIMIWDAATGERKLSLQAHDRPISTLAFSPDGTALASGGADHRVRVWDVSKTSVE